MTGKRWIIAALLACVLAVPGWLGYRALAEARSRKVAEQESREMADTLIRGNYLHIPIGEGKEWRPAFERLLSERYGLRFTDRNYCGTAYYQSEMLIRSPASARLMDEEVARRFKPGELEAVAEEAERVHRETIAAELAMDPRPVFPEEVIRSWGYRTTGSERVLQAAWETQWFGKATVRRQSIKALAEVKDWENAYYRFRIAEETFSTPEKAEMRIKELQVTPPGMDTKKEPHRVLCDGVAVGKTAYIVSTDSVKFQMEALPAVMKLMKAEVEKERASGIKSGDE